MLKTEKTLHEHCLEGFVFCDEKPDLCGHFDPDDIYNCRYLREELKWQRKNL
jgi:hypothetical protein